MWQQLGAEIGVVCRAKIRKHERRRSQLAAVVDRRSKRSTHPARPITTDPPDLWVTNRNLNPYDVLKRSQSLAFGIQRSIRNGSYAPHTPTFFPIPKSSGPPRIVSSFEIADEAVSRLLFQSMTRKNRALFGAHSYAYREDLGVYDAVRFVSSEWAGKSRLFIAQFDLRAYFDSIQHAYLFDLLADSAIVATSLERSLCRQFALATPGAPDSNGILRAGPSGASGIPQGTTISLFLANLAMLPLDRALEDLGVKFTRYADDLLFWSDDYRKASVAVEKLSQWSASSGVQMNHEKSRGLRLLVSEPKPEPEIRSVDSVDYLGHRIGLRGVEPKPARLTSAKTELERLIYIALLKEPISGTQRLSRVYGQLDRDYVSLIWQLRRKLYGHLSEHQVRRLRRGFVPATGLTGLIAQFPVVTDRAQFRDLDTWLRRRVWLALRKRASILRPLLGRRRSPKIWDLPFKELLSAQGRSVSTGQNLDLTMPSAIFMAELVQRSIQLHGPAVVRGSSRLYLDP